MNVLCIGDSLTRGYDVPYGQGWVELLQAQLGASIKIVNAGVDGATLQAIFNNVDRALDEQTYDIVCIMGGTNDILHGRLAEDCYFNMLRSVKRIQKVGAEVVIGLAPQIDCDPDGDDAVLVSYNHLLKMYCQDHGLTYIDFYATIAEADQRGEILYAGDVHPNELGYRYMYETALDVLRPKLK
ncbi:SGNH/GDSL hydrolase family protein [Veillonella criceti]|uniref:Arylesterase n=1 Tax=Veillonella criceti TaxID=103891 RepID=A0A380NN93_9FIRM|nr:SGNH/GDSL hydrolase family protein [Veillonella criceti]SUP44049.1 Arylesterase precursor [Veillonella criceti]